MKNLSVLLSIALLLPVLSTTSALATKGKNKQKRHKKELKDLTLSTITEDSPSSSDSSEEGEPKTKPQQIFSDLDESTPENYSRQLSDNKQEEAQPTEIISPPEDKLTEQPEENISEEEYSDFEEKTIKRENALTQKQHWALWKGIRNPSAPSTIISLLANFKEEIVPADEVEAYQGYVNKAIGQLADEFNANHEKRKTCEDVVEKRTICSQNATLTQTLKQLFSLAKHNQLEISQNSKQIAAHWLSENRAAIKELFEAEKKELVKFSSVENEISGLLGTHTLSGLLDRFKKVKAERLQGGLKKGSNLEKVISINVQLVEALKSGEANLNEVALFVQTLQNKGVQLDSTELASLHNAIREVQNNNDSQFKQEAQERLNLDESITAISQNLTELMKSFNSDETTIVKKTPLVDYINKFEGFAPTDENKDQ